MPPAKRIFFILGFSLLVLIGSQVNFSPLVGAENQFFTLFQFFGPTAGAFLGPMVGAASVLIAELVSVAFAGKEASLINIARLAPMLFAAAYFGVKKADDRRLMAVVPLLAMAAFWLHPVGQQAWFFALYWLIPVIATLKPNLISRSFGATFTAHAVGGAFWVWSVPMPAEAWIALIPVVAIERTLFAFGIAGSYVAMNTVMSKLHLPVFEIDPRYAVSKRFFGIRA